MKKFLPAIILAALLCAVAPMATAAKREKMPAPERKAFSNVSLGISASTMGYGIQAATPLHRSIAMRVGIATLPGSYKYNQSIEPIDVYGEEVQIPDLRLKATAGMTHGMLLFDFTPFRRGKSSFYITLGAYFGSSKLLKLSGKMNPDQLAELQSHGIQITDIPVNIGSSEVMLNADGSMNASLKVWAVKPYVGLGFGRPIPKRRVGFRGEIGAAFIGKPKVESANVRDIDSDGEIGTINKILGKVIVYPNISLTLTVRLLKDKK